MSLSKSTGNMYPWVTHMHNHLGGKCGHNCTYCYVDSPRWGRPPRYQGPIRLIEKEFKIGYGSGKTIFIEHKNDICGPGVTIPLVDRILNHCSKWPDNTYVFQSKNPGGFVDFLSGVPGGSIIGATIETNRDTATVSDAPQTEDRYVAMRELDWPRKFITIEPVMDFDVDVLARWISDINPEFLNLGADSKRHDLPEPSRDKIDELVEALASYGIELREKHNLERLTGRER